MNENDYEDAPAAMEPEPDPRIIAMHQVVDLEQQYERATLEAERRQKTAAIVQNELREARDRLASLLGYPSNANKAQAMSGEEARAIAEARRIADRMNR